MENEEKTEPMLRQVCACPECGGLFTWFRKFLIRAKPIHEKHLQRTLVPLDFENESDPEHIEYVQKLHGDEEFDSLANALLSARNVDYNKRFERERGAALDRTSSFSCPFCSVGLQFLVECRIVGLETVVHKPKELRVSLRERNPEYAAIVDYCMQTGVLSALTQALTHQLPLNDLPTDMGHYLLQFLLNVVKAPVPGYVMKYYRAKFKGVLEFWKAHGLTMVVEDGMIRSFFPTRATGKPVWGSGVRVQGKVIGKETRSFAAWTKTKYGYVPSESKVVLSELRKRSLGEFGKGLV